MPIYAPLWALMLIAEAAAGVSLTTDARVGTLRDPVGGVVVREAGEARGRPVGEEEALLPGDRLDVDLHVAGAVTVELGMEGKLVLGPGARLAVSTEGVIRWLEGPLCAYPAAGQKVDLEGPDGGAVGFDKELCAEAKGMKSELLEGTPTWVREYREGMSLRSLGALTATVEGKEVPLALVRHAVTVEIRDGLALTTVENVFRNGTNSELEGVFEFPLPEDASVAEFGVWYGDRLVLADVAEKGRARQVYQTLMMERKAPGLLEVAQGNRFRTRIYPIPAQGEKRIRIAYTQVLGWNGHGWNYVYPLVSEMTRTAGLEELRIHVVVWSQRAVQTVKSLYQPAAVETTANSARVEYVEQGARPEHDFALDIAVSDEPGKLVWMPHVQGKDGYFLASLIRPVEKGAAEARTKPVDVVFWVDSSGSMGADERKKQRETVLGVLQALGPDDRFRLVACDGSCVWMEAQPMAATPDSVEQASQFLDKRVSLGWTNLPVALATVLKSAGPDSHVIYLGDGLETEGKPDSLAAAQALEKVLTGYQGRLSAVALGRATDRVVLKRMVRAGRGTLVDGTGDVGSGRLVAGLLEGMTSLPVADDLRLEGKGVKLGAVVSSEATGDGQRVWVGRFDPATISSEALVEVKPVVAAGEVADAVARVTPSLPEEGRDNSLVVRFWARRYIDQLLDGLDAAKAREEVIGLSEEYGVLSPYTSFIVIDSDAERARFGVKRLVRMGNGERFFAEGRAKAEGELAQKAMLAGQRWRQGLKARLAQRLSRPDLATEPLPQAYPSYLGSGWIRTMSLDSTGDLGVGLVGAGGGGAGTTTAVTGSTWEFDEQTVEGKLSLESVATKADKLEEDKPMDGHFEVSGKEVELPPAEPAAAPAPEEALDGLFDRSETRGPSLNQSVAGDDYEWKNQGEGGYTGGLDDFGGEYEVAAGEMSKSPAYRAAGRKQKAAGAGALGRNAVQGIIPGAVPLGPQEEPWWTGELIPRQRPASVAPDAPEKSSWDLELVALSQSVSRVEWLSKQASVRLLRRTALYTEGSRQPYSVDVRVLFAAPDRWLVNTKSSGYGMTSLWVEKGRFTELNQVTGIARSREAVDGDKMEQEMSYSLFLMIPPHLEYPEGMATLTSEGDFDVITVRHNDNPNGYEKLYIDRTRHLVAKLEIYEQDVLLAVTEVESATEVGGAWMPTSILSKDGEGRVTRKEQLNWSLVSQEVLAGAFTAVNEALKRGLEFEAPAPTLVEAKEHVAQKKGRDADLLVLISREAQLSRFDRALGLVEQLAAAHPGAEGPLWMRLVLLAQARRQNAAQGVLEELADRWLGEKRPGSFYAADYLYRQASQTLIGDGLLDYVDKLKPLFEEAELPERGLAQWGEAKTQALDNAGRSDEARQLRLELVRQYPTDFGLLSPLVWLLLSDGESATAVELIDKALEAAKGNASQEESLTSLKLDVYSNEYDGEAMVAAAKAWMEGNRDGFSQCYTRYLTALEAVGDSASADKVARQWMEQALKVTGGLTQVQQAMLTAAVSYAMGWDYSSRVKPALEALVADCVYRGLSDPTFSQATYQVLSNDQFKQMPVGKKLWERVRADLLQLSVPRSIERTNGLWTAYQSLGQVEKKDAQAVLAALTAQVKVPGALATSRAWSLYRSVSEMVASSAELREERLAFERLMVSLADDERLPGAVLTLFQQLCGAGATAEQLDEAASLVVNLGSPKEEGERALLRLAAVDRLAQAWSSLERLERVKALRGGENRRLRSDEMASIQKESAKAVADRLAGMGAKIPELAGMARLKELAIRLTLDAHTGDVLAEALKVVEEQSGASGVRADGRSPLLERAAQLASAAAMRSREPAVVEKVVAMYERMAAAAKKSDERVGWQMEVVALLVAADQPEALEAHLNSYLEGGVTSASWDVMLASILAERGRIEKAADLLEKASKREPLDSPGTALLTALRTAMPGRNADEAVRLKEYLDTAQEWEIQNLVQVAMNQQRVEGSEPRANEDLLLKLRALFAKARYPQNYVYLANQAFSLTQDGRVLLAMLESLEGMSDEQIGALLLNLVWVIQGIQNEAALEVVARELQQKSSGAKTARLKRQVALVQLMVERAGVLIQGSGQQHEQKALQALNAAAEGVTEPGEAANVLAVLNGMGAFDANELNKARSGVALQLLATIPEGSARSLVAAAQVANILMFSEESGRAFDLLKRELDARLKVTDNVLYREEFVALDALVGLALPAGSLRQTEEYIVKLSSGATQRQKSGLLSRRIRLYGDALSVGAAMAAGKGLTLVTVSLADVDAMAPESAPSQVAEMVFSLSNLFRSAKYADVHVEGFMPEFRRSVLERWAAYTGSQWSNVIQTASGAVREVVGAKESLAFLLDAAAKAPKFRPYYDHSVFGQLAYQIAYLMEEIPDLGTLEKPILDAALEELRRDLLYGRGNNRQLYSVSGGQRFQQRHAPEFLKEALKVGETQLACPPCAVYTAQYIVSDLEKVAEGAALLEKAHKTFPLQDSWLQWLAQLWMQAKRYDKALPMAASLSAKYPDNFQLRLTWLEAAGKSKKGKEAEKVLAETTKHWKELGSWSGDIAGGLGVVAVDSGLHAASLPLLGEAISVRQVAGGVIGVDYQLSRYLVARSKAELALGRNDQALEDGLTAMLAGGTRGADFEAGKAAAKVALEQMKGLDSWLAEYEAKEKASGQMHPLVHSMAAEIYSARKRPAEAIHHYKVALDARHDSEQLLKLMQLLEQQGQKELLVAEGMKAAGKGVLDAKTAAKLSDALFDLGRPEDALRALTATVELRSDEAQPRVELANQLKEKQKGSESMKQWEVAAELAPKDGSIQINYAAALISQKQMERAKELLEKLLGAGWLTASQKNRVQNMLTGLKKQP